MPTERTALLQPCIFLRHQVYHPGNILEGAVRLVARATCEATSIRVKFVGKEISEGITPDGETERVKTYYWREMVTIIGSLEHEQLVRQRFTIPQGSYNYPFAIQIPATLPPSVHHQISNGAMFSVQFYVKVPFKGNAADLMERTYAKVYFAIVRPAPLMQMVSSGPRALVEEWALTGCCCWDRGRIACEMRVRRGLASLDGESVAVTLSVDNTHSRVTIREVTSELYAIVTARTPHSVECVAHVRLVRTTTKVFIEPGKKTLVIAELAVSRRYPPTTTGAYGSVRHEVRVSLGASWVEDLVMSVPVTFAHSTDLSNVFPSIHFGAFDGGMVKHRGFKEEHYLRPHAPVMELRVVQLPRPRPLVAEAFAPFIPLPSQPSENFRAPLPPGPPAAVMEGAEWLPGCPQHRVSEDFEGRK